MENKGLVPFMDLAHNSLLMLELTREEVNPLSQALAWVSSLGVHTGSFVLLLPWLGEGGLCHWPC